MHRHLRMRDLLSVWLVIAALATLTLALAPAVVKAIPPRPNLYDPETGLTITGHRPPEFPEWFGKGVQPLRAISGEGRAVALLIDFPDRQANHIARPASIYNDLLFSLSVYPTGSLRDFYLEQSYGTFNVTGEAVGWVRTSEDYATTYDDGYFGFAGGGLAVAKAAIRLADPLVDFGIFDSDGPDEIPNSGDDDGYVDACFIFCSGAGGHDTGNPSDIWAYASGFDPNYITNDPAAGGGFIRFLTYTIQPEIGVHINGDSVMVGLGVAAHEYGHVLGLPDLYDGSRETWGIGYWCLMSYGSWLMRGTEVHSPVHLSAWCKEKLGWVTPTIVTQNIPNLTIPPVESSSIVYKVWRDGLPGEEYFLLENRQNQGFDDILPGQGLLIWHIDNTSTAPTNLVDLEEADGRDDLEHGTGVRPDGRVYHPELGDSGDPYPGDSLNTQFNNSSYPASWDNQQNPTNVSIENIQLDGINVRMIITIDEDIAVLFNDFRAHVNGTDVELIWDVSADEPIKGFDIYRKKEGNAIESSIIENKLLSPRERRFVDRDTDPGSTYYYVISAVTSDDFEIRSPQVKASIMPLTLALSQNYPNPFNPVTTIKYTLPKPARVSLKIYDVQGKFVVCLEEGLCTEGSHLVTWDGRDAQLSKVSTGIYFYRLKVGDKVLTKKMALLR